MKFKTLYVILLISVYALTVTAQSPNNFQQKVNHSITVTLNDSLHELQGNTKITYFNQSPDTLSYIYIHLWANGYRDNNSAFAKQKIQNEELDFFYSKKEDRGQIDHLDFKINGQKVLFSYIKNHADIALIDLPQPLLPGDSMVIETPFWVKIPGDFSRMGHQEQAYQITQWYPKPAVYDFNGWHPHSYLNYGEYYSDFGSFDVSITLPKNYFVAATGVLIHNPEEENRITERIKETKKENIIRTNDIPVSAQKMKTLRFFQDSIHDFAWFADKRFLILQRKVVMPHTQKEVLASAYFLPDNYDLWDEAPLYISWALAFYSEKLGDYPYSHCTAVDGALNNGGGMEYPMITVINGAYSKRSNEEIIMHEVGHNWFYGMLGFNERDYPWLDEGLNTFYENEYLDRYYPNDGFLEGYDLPKKIIKNDFPNFYSNYFSYLMVQSTHEYQPCGLPSSDYSKSNYFISVYRTPVMFWRYFKQACGDSLFHVKMGEFFNKWSFKHPDPIDLQLFWEQELGVNLDWFFETLVNTTTPIDMCIKSVKPIEQDRSFVCVKTKDKTHLGGFYSISFLDKEGFTLTEDWFISNGRINSDTLMKPDGADKIFVNYSLNIPEINKRDNQMRLHGWFKKTDFPKFYFLWRVSDPYQNSVLYTPVAGWNMYDKWMVGASLYSDPVVKPKVDFMLLPMYSIQNKALVGMGDIGYSFANLFPFLNVMRIGILAKQFGYQYFNNTQHYQKWEPSVRLDFKPNYTKSRKSQLLIRAVFVHQETNTTNDNTGNSINEYSIVNGHYFFKSEQKLNPWSFDVDAQIYKQTLKIAAEINAEYTFAKEKGIHGRLFAGKMANPSSQFLPNLNFNVAGISGSYTGSSDYLFDHTLFGRSETTTFFGQQMVRNDGGFVTPTPLGRSNDWLISANFSIDIFKKIPISLFFNISTFSGASKVLENGELFIYEAGVSIPIIRQILEINIPLFISKDMQRVSDLNQQQFVNRIRFIFNLNKLNPIKAASKYAQTLI